MFKVMFHWDIEYVSNCSAGIQLEEFKDKISLVALKNQPGYIATILPIILRPK